MRIQDELRNAGVPNKFISRATAERMKLEESEKKVADIYLDKLDAGEILWGKDMFDGHGLVFQGPARTGKSCAAALFARRILHKTPADVFHGRKVRIEWTTAVKIVDDLRDSYSNDESVFSDESWHESLLGKGSYAPSILFIDDFGKERATKWSSSVLAEVLHTRNDRELSSIIITDLSMADIKHNYGEATHTLLECEFSAVNFTHKYVGARIVDDS